jgi:hypothetical protein
LPIAKTQQAGPMKALTATVLLLALSAVALAKPNPVDRTRVAFVYADINMGSVGAMRENIGSVGAMRERTTLKRRNRRSTLALRHIRRINIFIANTHKYNKTPNYRGLNSFSYCSDDLDENN